MVCSVSINASLLAFATGDSLPVSPARYRRLLPVFFGPSSLTISAKSPILGVKGGENEIFTLFMMFSFQQTSTLFSLYERYHLPEHHTQGENFVFTPLHP